jgi:hypothetical protein
MSTQKFLAPPLTEAEKRFLDTIPRALHAGEITDFERFGPALREQMLAICVMFFGLPKARRPVMLELMKRYVARRLKQAVSTKITTGDKDEQASRDDRYCGCALELRADDLGQTRRDAS